MLTVLGGLTLYSPIITSDYKPRRLSWAQEFSRMLFENSRAMFVLIRLIVIVVRAYVGDAFAG
jgi:hypothetical protein